MPASQTQATPLHARGNPVQRRSQARTDQILSAAKSLLTETPVENITTTDVANRAGMPVSSLYRYFPNVFSIFNALIEPVIEEQNKRLSDVLDNADAYDGWRQRHYAIMTAIRATLDERPYYRRLFPIVMARPELHAPKEKLTNSIVERLAERWRQGGDGFSGADPAVVAQFTTQICLAIETYLVTLEKQEDRDQYFTQLSVNLESYLSNYLND